MNRLLLGDCRLLLPQLIAEGVRANCVVTSPPYWGLRDYGVDGQIGLEATPEEYVANLVAVFRLVRELLHDDGTLWLNLGDTYTAGGRGGDTGTSGLQGSTASQDQSKAAAGQRMGCGSSFRRDRMPRQDAAHKAAPAIARKNLIGIPWRAAFALQADGWNLRSDIIWAKPNPMPESVTDRPTKSHEYIFLLTKGERYFYDAAAIREPDALTDHPRSVLNPPEPTGGLMPAHSGLRSASGRQGAGRNKRSVWTITTKPFAGAHFATFPPDLIEPCILAGTSARGHCPSCGAGWDRIVELSAPNEAQKRYAGADSQGEYHGAATKNFAAAGAQDASATKARILASMRERITVGWYPSCACYCVAHLPAYPKRPEDEAQLPAWEKTCQPIRAERQRLIDRAAPLITVPAVVLDPFMGSGTTAQVAQRLGRHWLGIELNPEYEKLQRDRTQQLGMPL